MQLGLVQIQLLSLLSSKLGIWFDTRLNQIKRLQLHQFELRTHNKDMPTFAKTSAFSLFIASTEISRKLSALGVCHFTLIPMVDDMFKLTDFPLLNLLRGLV